MNFGSLYIDAVPKISRRKKNSVTIPSPLPKELNVIGCPIYLQLV